MAGETDGGGMGPRTEHRVLANLNRIGGEVADRCARGVWAGNQDAEHANQEEQEEMKKQVLPKQKKQ
jgi:hypothetical protein